MKKISFIFAISIFALVLFSCNAKEKKKIDATDNDVITEEDFEDFDFNEEADDSLIVSEETLEVIDREVSVTVEKKEPILEEKEDGSLSEVSEEDLKKAEEKQKKEPKKEHIKKFYVIAGSFQEINNAVDLRAYLKTKGFPAMVLYPYKGYNRVAVKSFMTREQAEAEIRKVRSMNMSYKDENLEYWLLWR